MIKMKKQSNLFLYLTRRDKSGVRFLSQFHGQPQLATRIQNLSDLKLSSDYHEGLSQLIFDSRMMWELWLESADSIDVLRQNLKQRGYVNLPLSNRLEYKNLNNNNGRNF